MAILSEGGNEYEVKIIRRPQDTYFTEHVKVGNLEKPDAESCERYIVAESGQRYAIEVTIKQGFRWGHFDEIDISMAFIERSYIACMILRRVDYGRQLKKEDVTVYLDCLNFQVARDLVGAPFCFRGLAIDESLQDETNVRGQDPLDLATFEITIWRRRIWEKDVLPKGVCKTVRADFATRNVDARSFKKHGISFTNSIANDRINVNAVTMSQDTFDGSVCLNFNYHCHTSDFLEQLSIVPYPPPLHHYPWEGLNDIDCQRAFLALQVMSKSLFGLRSGLSANDGYERREWRSWQSLNLQQKKAAFKKLQEEHKAFERGEVLSQFAAVPSHRLIDLEAEPTQSSRQPKRGPVATNNTIKWEMSEVDNNRDRKVLGKRQRSESVASNSTMASEQPRQKSKDPSIRLSNIKQEPIDLDAINVVAQRASTSSIRSPNIKQEPIDLDAPDVLHRQPHIPRVKVPKIKQEVIDLYPLDDDYTWDDEITIIKVEKDGTDRHQHKRIKLEIIDE